MSLEDSVKTFKDLRLIIATEIAEWEGKDDNEYMTLAENIVGLLIQKYDIKKKEETYV